jgi:hypothetical protein
MLVPVALATAVNVKIVCIIDVDLAEILGILTIKID